MSLWQAILLGIVQGITEFFPISSSAHLKLAKWILGIADGEHLLYFDLLCHLGTLLALILYLHKSVWEVLSDWKKWGLYALALFPLVPAYFFLKPLRLMASEPQYLGYAMMITAALLFAASRKRQVDLYRNNLKNREFDKEAPQNFCPERVTIAGRQGASEDKNFEEKPTPSKTDSSSCFGISKKWPSVLCIGVIQTMALVPGISRSASTIAMARFWGWEWREAAQFSFLLAIPTILGGELLETVKGHPPSGVPLACYAGGLIASFALGLVAVRWIFWIYEKEKVRPIAWYCLAAGLCAWIAFHG